MTAGVCGFLWYYILACHLSHAGFFAKSQIMFFFYHHSGSYHRSRMTAGENCVFNGITFLPVILERSEESGQRVQVLNTFLQLSYAGFFAKSHIIFFSSIIIPILSTAQE